MEVTTPKLRNWYVEIVREYPAMDSPAGVDDPENPKFTTTASAKLSFMLLSLGHKLNLHERIRFALQANITQDFST
ncbi:MAG: hypothetical protein ACJ74Y_06940 [Bryobacteraceae bacterium]